MTTPWEEARKRSGPCQACPPVASRADDRGVVEVLDHEVYTRDYGARPIRVITCGACGRMWDDAVPTAWTPAPSGRCPFEYEHEDDR